MITEKQICSLHPTTLYLHPQYEHLRDFMYSLPDRFSTGEGSLIHDGRNKLREITYGEDTFIVKAYKKPNIINQCIYGFLRPSKAMRAFRNALTLVNIGVGTPQPVGYINIRQGLLFSKSFLVTIKSKCRFRYDQLFTQPFENEEMILREIGYVTAVLHNNGVAHLDYGRGNILFDWDENGKIRIELVDLNRMRFGSLDMKAGCKNLERLPATAQMHGWIAEEYAKERGFDKEKCYQLMRHFRSLQPYQEKNEFTNSPE